MQQKDFYKSRYGKYSHGDLPDRYSDVIDLIVKKNPKRFLDLGCGDGFFSCLVKERIPDLDAVGVDIGKEGIEKARESGIRAFCINIDQKNLPFEDNFFDVIFCGELIEHLFDPDHLLTEIHRLLKDDGVCILTTPNLASWFNRIALLLGYQPFFTEVSTKYGVGHLFSFWLNAGHYRLFTYRALCQLIRIYDFDIEKVYGLGINTKIGLGKKFFTAATVTNFLFKYFPSLASDITVVFRKKR